MGKRSRFYSTCACIILPLLFLCLYARFNLLAFADGEAPYYIWNKEKTNTTQEKQYDVIILGDSVANASYLPAILSDRCLNLSLGGTTPMENYYTMKDWLDHNAPPRVCYISFTDYHFNREDVFWERPIYTHRYSVCDEMAMLLSAMEFDESSILVDGYLNRLIEFDLGAPNRYMTAIVNSVFGQRKEKNQLAKDEVDLRGGAYIADQREYWADTDILYDSFFVSPLFNTYYHKLIELCLENNIQVRIVKLPMPDNAVFSPKFTGEFHDYYTALQETYPKITVDWIENYPMNCFEDEYHMNFHGARRFSTEIKEIYPEDFGADVYSEEQAKAIHYYIDQENRVDELFKWISGKAYTAIIDDGTGEFERYYRGLVRNEPSLDALKMNMIIFKGKAGSNSEIFVVSGKKELMPPTISIENGMLGIHFDGASQQFDIDKDSLSVIVLDRCNQQLVSHKKFKWSNDQFVLM